MLHPNRYSVSSINLKVICITLFLEFVSTLQRGKKITTQRVWVCFPGKKRSRWNDNFEIILSQNQHIISYFNSVWNCNAEFFIFFSHLKIEFFKLNWRKSSYNFWNDSYNFFILDNIPRDRRNWYFTLYFFSFIKRSMLYYVRSNESYYLWLLRNFGKMRHLVYL